MCAPYQVLASYRYKVKLTPGGQKRGKAARQVRRFQQLSSTLVRLYIVERRRPAARSAARRLARCDTLWSCQCAQEYRELKARFEQPMCSAEAGRLRCCWLLCARPGFKTF